MNAVTRIRAEVAAQMDHDVRLAQQIATFLAGQSNDEVVPFYTRQADEIVAMVRDIDRGRP